MDGTCNNRSLTVAGFLVFLKGFSIEFLIDEDVILLPQPLKILLTEVKCNLKVFRPSDPSHKGSEV